MGGEIQVTSLGHSFKSSHETFRILIIFIQKSNMYLGISPSILGGLDDHVGWVHDPTFG